MKKVLAFTLITILILASSISSFAASGAPSDVAGTKYETAVSTLISAGIVKGYPDGTFKPTQTLNRAEACKMIVTALNPTFDSSYSPVFSDLAGYAWASSDIAYAAKSGIINGYGDNTFRPSNIVTLNEMITMTIRAMGYTDTALNANWPTGFVGKATDLGILAGIDLNMKNTDRGTAAILIYNGFYLSGNLPGITNKIGVVISKATAASSGFNALTVIDADGVTSTYNVPKANKSFDSLDSGAIIGFNLDSSGNVNRLVKKEPIYAYNNSFTGVASYNGIGVNTDAKIFTFGVKTDFSAIKANFTATSSDYGVNSIRLMQNVSTSAYYVVENGKITAMIMPTDVGFTGRAYGMITDTFTAANIDGKAVGGLNLLLGTNLVKILKNDTMGIPVSGNYLSGEAYEIYLKNGVANNIATSTSTDPVKKNIAFVDMTSGYKLITDTGSSYIVVENGSDTTAIELSADAAIYVVTYDSNNKAEGYKAGSISSLRDGVYVRAYDVTNDNEALANIVVVAKYRNAR